MDLFVAQRRMAALQLYAGDIDGRHGPKTEAAIAGLLLQQRVEGFENWPASRKVIAACQAICRIDGIEVGKIDGLTGTLTRHAFEVYDARAANGGKPVASVENWRDADDIAPVAARQNHAVWPRQKDVMEFYGAPGSDQVSCELPYPMRLAWDMSAEVHRFQCHSKCESAFKAIFAQTLAHYGHDRIKALRLDLFGGCLNVRKMRGGSRWSMHSWGCAMDVDPEHNALKEKKPQATLSGPEYDEFWEIVYGQGALSLGRERDYDWMHFQFTRDFS